METRTLLLILVMAAAGCSAAGPEDEPVEIPEVPAAELRPERIAGPLLECRADAGALACLLTAGEGFQVQMLSVLVQTNERVEEHTYAGDTDLAALKGAMHEIVLFERYPVDIDIQLHFAHESISTSSNANTTITESSVRCALTLNGAQSAPIVCDAGEFERWNAYLVPDPELVDAWEAGQYGVASVRATLELEARNDAMCFREYPTCGASGLTEEWFEVADDSGDIPEALRYTFTVPAEAASTVTVTTNVMYNPTPLSGPGVYVVGAHAATRVEM